MMLQYNIRDTSVHPNTTPMSYNSKSYYVSVTNDYTWWSTIECITKENNMVSKYKEYKAWLSTQHGWNIKILQSNHGGENLSDNFSTYLKGWGMVRHLTVHDTLEENGVAKWLNQMLLEHAWAMLISVNLPKNLWPKAIHHVMWLKNCMLTWALNGKTPHEMLFGIQPNLWDLPEWGASVFVMTQLAGKLDVKSKEAQLVGYSGMSQGHHIYQLNM